MNKWLKSIFNVIISSKNINVSLINFKKWIRLPISVFTDRIMDIYGIFLII